MAFVPSKLADWFVHYKRFGRHRQLFDRAPAAMRPLASFPRIIHLYWNSGEDDAPPLVRRCIRSWREANPGWTIRLWDDESAPVRRSDFPPDMKIAAYSDLLRLDLLEREGGVWVDATLMCLQPLDNWLLVLMMQTDFFAFHRPGPDREISSWLIASRPRSTIVTDLAAACRAFWARRSTATRSYFWFHYLFEYSDRTSRRFRRLWSRVPRLSAIPALQLALDLAADRVADDPSGYRAAPVAKLTYKQSWDVAMIERLLGLPPPRE